MRKILRFFLILTGSSIRTLLAQSLRPLQRARKTYFELSGLNEILTKTMVEQDQCLGAFKNSMEDLSASAQEISNINLSVINQVEASRKDTEDGAICVRELRQVTEGFTNQQKEFDPVLDLMHSVRQATNIIDEIVFQTSLLSFNASVEAERAGESGRGFSIVAQEIKQLAESSQKASNDISKKIDLCISALESLVFNLSKGIDSLASNTDVTYRKFDSIKHSTTNLTKAVQNITEGTSRQSLAISKSLHELNRFTQLNARNSRFSMISIAEITKDIETSLGQITDSTQRSLWLVGGASLKQNAFWNQVDRILSQIKDVKDLHSALEIVAKTIPQFTQWNISHVFLPDENNMISSAKIWSRLTEREKQSEFYQFSSKLTFEPGIGLPGRVFKSKHFEQNEYGEEKKGLPRNKVALALGIKVGIGFPILSRDERVLAIIEFFSYEKIKPDADFIEAICQIGEVIGGKAL